MKNKPDNNDRLYTVLICLCLLVIACVETFTSGILKRNDESGQPITNIAESTAIEEHSEISPLEFSAAAPFL